MFESSRNLHFLYSLTDSFCTLVHSVRHTISFLRLLSHSATVRWKRKSLVTAGKTWLMNQRLRIQSHMSLHQRSLHGLQSDRWLTFHLLHSFVIQMMRWKVRRKTISVLRSSFCLTAYQFTCRETVGHGE